MIEFDLNDDNKMLQSLVERFVQERYGADERRQYQSNPEGFDPQNWSMLGELGLIATAFDEADGGFASDVKSVMVLFEVLGRGLVCEPLIESIYEAGVLFALTARPELRTSWMDAIMSGEKRLALAHVETQMRDNLSYVEMRAEISGDGFSLTGCKSLVPAGVHADGYIVSALLPDTPPDALRGKNMALFFVPAGSKGLQVTPYRLVDGSAACRLDFDAVAVPANMQLDAADASGWEAYLTVRERADVARCAEALGIMERIFAATIEHLQTRRQFGQPLANFQALQHRMVEQYVAMNEARALLNKLTAVKPNGDTGFRKLISGARAFIAEASVALGHEVIQLNGGMGVSDEVVVGQGHKRIMFLARYPTTADLSLDIYAGITPVHD